MRRTAGISYAYPKRIDISYTSSRQFVYLSHTQWVIVRDAAINLRALPEQRDLIDQAASALGKFDQFVALLDAPPKPNAGLERLMGVKAPWDANPA